MSRVPEFLVTGAGGQLGRALARHVPDAILLGRCDLDVTDAEAVQRTIDRYRPRVIVHAAAWTRVDEAEAAPSAAWIVNVGGTRVVAEAAARIRALLVYPSSDYVFPGTVGRPYREDDPAGPISVYGTTKLEGEESAKRVKRHLIVRTSWVFGEGNCFPLAIVEAAQERDEIRVVSDQVGRPTYALDLAQGILQLVDKRATGLFHLAGGGDPCSWADFAEVTLERAVGASMLERAPRVVRVTTKGYDSGRMSPVARRPRYSVLDCSKAASLGVRLRPWPEALGGFLASFRPKRSAIEVET